MIVRNHEGYEDYKGDISALRVLPVLKVDLMEVTRCSSALGP